MSFVNQDTLKSFMESDNYLVTEDEPAGLAEAISQADDIITLYTGVTVPDSPDDARAFLRNIACALVVWYTTGQQSNLSDEELSRRRSLYNNAMQELRDYKAGKTKPAGSDDTLFYMTSTQRIDEAI